MSTLGAEHRISREVTGLRRRASKLRRELDEEPLKTSESPFALIFNGVSDLLFLIGVETGPQFRCLMINHSYVKRTGRTREQMEGKLIEEIVSQEQARFVIAKYTAAMQTRGPIAYEESTDVPAGQIVVETTLTPVFDEQGNCTHLLGASRDITERKRMVKALERRVRERTADLQQANEILQAEIEERERVEAALRAAEEDYRALFENAVEGIYRSSLDGKQLRANPALVKLNGYSSEEEQIAGVNDIATEWYVAPHRREEFARILEEQGTVTDFESEIYRHKTRERIWISETARLVRDTNGTPLYYEGTVQDITAHKHAEEALRTLNESLEHRVAERTAELARTNDALRIEIDQRKRTEEALRESEQRYRDLFENANDMITTLALDGTFTSVNKQAEIILGFSRNELIGTDSHMIALPSSAARGDERTRRVLAGKRVPPMFEIEVVRKDGRTVPLEARVRFIRDKNGLPVGFQGIYRDITERKKAERALRESEERYRVVSQSISDYAFSFHIGAQGEPTLEWLTDSFTQVTGYPAFEVVGKPNPLSHYVHPEDLARLLHTIRSVQPGKPVTYEFRIIRKDGVVRWLQSRVQAIADENGKLTRLYGAAHDITERKLAEEALRQLQAELAHVNRVTSMGEMAASIAHEVNQPLGAIVGNADLCLRWLANETLNLDQVREALSDIIKDGHRASAVIARIRSLIKRETLQKTSFNINEVIGEAVALASHEVQRQLVRLRAELAADLPSVRGDRIQLGQVMLNLIMNGIEAMSGVEGRARDLILRSGRHGADRVLITVRDCGAGIDPREAKRIFAPFHTTKPGGMGMGLAICQSIVEAHGGRLWVESNDGLGAAFQFTLPCNCEEAM